MKTEKPKEFLDKSFSRGFLIGALMLLLLTSSCNLPARTPGVPVGTILPTEQGTTAVLPTNTSINGTPTALIPITGADLISLQCQFCVNDEAHAVLIMPESASFLVSNPITGINCLTAQVVNGRRIVLCHGKQASFTLNVCADNANCTQFPVTLQPCPLISQTGIATSQVTSTPAPVIVNPTNTTVPPTISANNSTPSPTQILPQVPTQVSTQISISPSPTASTTAAHAQPTKATRAPVPPQQSGIGIQDPEQFVRWYFGAVWQIRDYESLWNTYLTSSFKTVVSPGGYTEYVTWWNSVQHVDINSLNVIQNDATHALIRVNVTFTMKDGRIIGNQEYDYDLLYDANRQTWMFDVHS